MQMNEEAALATREAETAELAPTGAARSAQFEIQSAIIIARKFPRNEDACFQKLMRSCQRTAFAEDVAYRFPRGQKKDENGRWVQNIISGPSVYLAREGARIWGNIRFGLEIVADDEDQRTIRGWAWDLETNVKTSADDTFAKLIQRKNKETKVTEWVVPDERDLRELTNRRAAFLVRNCLLQLLPSDLVDDALATAAQALEKAAIQDPDAARKRLVAAFDQINIPVEQLEAYLGHKIRTCSPTEIANLRQIWKSISDGQSTWADYSKTTEADRNHGTLKPEDLAPGKEPNRGHGDEQLASAPLPEPPAARKETTI